MKTQQKQELDALSSNYRESLDALETYHEVVHHFAPLQAWMKVYFKVEQIQLLWSTFDYLRRVRELEWLHSQVQSNQRALACMRSMSHLVE